MVIKKMIEGFMQKRREEKEEEERLQKYRENEEVSNAEKLKKEADRLAALKQYSTSIEEYNKSLDIYPYKLKSNGEFPDPTNKNALRFIFKTYFNIATCFSYLNEYDKAISYLDKALKMDIDDNELKIKAFIGKGNGYYRKKMKVMKENPEENEKENYFEVAHECFSKVIDIDRNNAEAWYKKGHMEILLNRIKDAMLSFDNVIDINKSFENEDGIDLFDDIKREKGIKLKEPPALMRESSISQLFKAKSGHLVKNKGEMSIANFLFDHDLKFQYEPLITWSDRDYKPLFYLTKLDVYIEHFEFDKVLSYRKLMKWKMNQYNKFRKKFIYTTSDDEKNLYDTLKNKLKPYIIL